MSSAYRDITPHVPLSEDDERQITKTLYDWGVDTTDLPEVMRLIKEHVEGLPADHKDVAIVIDSDFPNTDLLFKAWTVVGTAHRFDDEGYIHLGYTHDGVLFINVVRPDLHVPPVFDPSLAS